MKLSTKAALFSAFVFPGSGYFALKQNSKGFLCLALVLSTLGVFMIEAFHKAQLIAHKIVIGQIPYSIPVIREEIIMTPGRFDAEVITYASWFIVILWLFSIFDAYRLGKAQELK